MRLFKTNYLNKYAVVNAFFRRNLYYQYNYNPKIVELMNQQIKVEQQAAQEYLNMAVTFLHPSHSLNGGGGFFIKMYKEELNHMLSLIQYHITRGGKPLICGLDPPIDHKNLTLLESMKQSLDMEKGITKKIEELIEEAENLKDRQCADFLTSIFLKEQMQSIHEISKHITNLTMINDHPDGIYFYDLELAKTYPYSYDIK